MKTNNVNIGECIKEISKSRLNNDSEFARRIGIVRQNVGRIYKNKSIDTELLRTICEVLDYNFFELFYENDVINNDNKAKYTVKVEMQLTEEEILKLGLRNKL